jgi:hypothetical protein
LPRQLEVARTSVLADWSDEEIQMIEEMLAASRARLERKLQHNGTALALEPSNAKAAAGKA